MIPNKKGLFGILFFAALGLWWIFCLPATLFDLPTSTVLFDKNDQLLGARIADDGQWRFPPGDSVPKRFKTALLTYEDEGFDSHFGISVKAILRAIKQNLSEGEVVSGASTITMQVMRMAGNNRSRTYYRKIIEIAQAFRAEFRYSKSELLNLYASNAPFGGNVVGLDAASWRYYGKSAHQLTWAEASALAVLPNAPGLIYPGRSPEAFLKKRNFLLKKLLENGKISQISYELSLLEPLPDAPKRLPQEAFHLTALVAKTRKGQRVRTTVDPELQSRCNRALTNRLKLLRQNHIQNGAVLIVNNHSGEVLAYLGNAKGDWKTNEDANDMIQTPRSSGSILKPFLYAGLLNQGTILPQQLIPDIPTQYKDFAPKNFDETFSGAVKANEALSRSLNIPAVRMLNQYGVDYFYEDLQSWGFTSAHRGAANYGLSLILGGAEVKLWDLVQAYRILASNCSQGKADRINYESVEESIELPVQMSKASSWFTLEALKEVTRPEERSAWEAFGSTSQLAWKTGTSYGFRDAWAVGTNPDFTVGVWIGNANGEGRPGLTGLNAAAPVLFDVFNFLPTAEWFQEPFVGLMAEEVCIHSGMRAGKDCPKTKTTSIPESCASNELCGYCTTVHLNESGTMQVSAQCYPTNLMLAEKRFALPPLQEWFFMKNNPGYQGVPDFDPACHEESKNKNIRLIYPASASTIFLPREYTGTKEKVVFKAACTDPSAVLFWHLDENYCGSTSGIHHLEINIDRGVHDIAILDIAGNEFKTQIRVD
ncbi:MAG TPA: penicillin-binding protein 1C [Cryomorphaceae bacterium]|nr:penicillin-binding protein 1C [Cryomorphaceae bacterium]